MMWRTWLCRERLVGAADEAAMTLCCCRERWRELETTGRRMSAAAAACCSRRQRRQLSCSSYCCGRGVEVVLELYSDEHFEPRSNQVGSWGQGCEVGVSEKMATKTRAAYPLDAGCGGERTLLPLTNAVRLLGVASRMTTFTDCLPEKSNVLNAVGCEANWRALT